MKASESRALSREEVAAEEVGRTTISSRCAAAATLVFLALILTVPVLQHIEDVRAYMAGERNSPWPQSLEIIGSFTDVSKLETQGGTFKTVLDRNAFLLERINRFETRLDNRSMLTKKLLGPVQEVLTRYLGAGNEKAYPGRDGWLFYRSDVDYLTGPSFLNEKVMERRSLTGNAWTPAPQPDPIKAIADFRQQLAARDVELVVVPVPVKPALISKPLSGAQPANAPLQNPAYGEFKQQLEASGVAVFDPSPILFQLLSTGEAEPYLVTDTHWTPGAMEAVADGLAGFLNEKGMVSAGRPVQTFRREPKTLQAMGDVAVMLKLPESSTLFGPETVTVHEVQGRTEGIPEEAEVLFLGDSFANIYSAEEMGWGRHAGLADQLAYRLGRPVERLIRNDNGSFTTREMIRDELARGNDPLEGKRVVVWEFATRELTSGDWKIFDFQPLETGVVAESGSGLFVPEPGEWIEAEAEVLEVSDIPVPGTVPYRDHVCMIRLRLLGGPSVDARETVAFMSSMRDNELTAVAEWQPGSRVSVRLSAWDDVFVQYGSLNQSELDDYLFLDAYGWAVPMASSAGTATLLAGLFGYAGLMLLLILNGCRQARGRMLKTGIGITGLAWLVMGTFIVGGRAVGDARNTPQETSVHAVAADTAEASRFRAQCAAMAEEAERAGEMVIRSDDWLFLRNELRHIGVGRFWGDAAASVSRASKPEYADPLPAVLDFHQQLRQEGIDLWMVPVPPKAVIYPDKLGEGAFSSEYRMDAIHAQFYDLLRQEGVEVLDLTPAFLQARNGENEALYCRQDSHWSAPAMQLLADLLGRKIAEQPWSRDQARLKLRKKKYELEMSGDLRQMLKADAPGPERIALDMVISEETGKPLPPDENSPVLLMGDSHALVFHSGGDMHAVGAGLADQLAFETGFACDLIGVKGSGAGPSRRTLYGKSRKNPEYLSGKKVVIWCFSAREFTEASGIAWRKMPVK